MLAPERAPQKLRPVFRVPCLAERSDYSCRADYAEASIVDGHEHIHNPPASLEANQVRWGPWLLWPMATQRCCTDGLRQQVLSFTSSHNWPIDDFKARLAIETDTLNARYLAAVGRGNGVVHCSATQSPPLSRIVSLQASGAKDQSSKDHPRLRHGALRVKGGPSSVPPPSAASLAIGYAIQARSSKGLDTTNKAALTNMSNGRPADKASARIGIAKECTQTQLAPCAIDFSM